MSDQLTETTQTTEHLQPTDQDQDTVSDLILAWHRHELGILPATWYGQERHLIVRQGSNQKLYPLAIFWTPADEEATTPPNGTTPRRQNVGAPPPTPNMLAEVINMGLDTDKLALVRVHYKDTERTLIVLVREDEDGEPDGMMPLAILWEHRDSENCTNSDGEHPETEEPEPDDAMRGCNDHEDDAPITAENVVDYMMEYESGTISEQRAIKMFQFLLDSGMILSLQGAYQRAAQVLLMMGLITKATTV